MHAGEHLDRRLAGAEVSYPIKFQHHLRWHHTFLRGQLISLPTPSVGYLDVGVTFKYIGVYQTPTLVSLPLRVKNDFSCCQGEYESQ